MSYSIYVFYDGPIPTAEEWEARIRAARFHLTFDRPVDFERDTGFRPVWYDGRKTGFEYARLDPRELLADWPSFRPMKPWDHAAEFIWGSRADEARAALIAASVLAAWRGGILYDPQEAGVYAGAEALVMARSSIAELDEIIPPP